jgi:hypothetical protein
MSKYFVEIHNILESNGESYESKYPEIAQKNVFSISTLAHGSANQVHWKLKGQKGQYPYESNVGKSFFLGRAQHEFIQNRMKYCLSEYPLEHITPKGEFKIVGHIDLLDVNDGYLLELKTTINHKFVLNQKTQKCYRCKLNSNDSIHRNVETTRLPEFILQAGTYAKLMQLQTGRDFGASIFVLNGTLTEYELTREDIENSFNIILKRGYETYEKLKFLGEIKN